MGLMTRKSFPVAVIAALIAGAVLSLASFAERILDGLQW